MICQFKTVFNHFQLKCSFITVKSANYLNEVDQFSDITENWEKTGSIYIPVI